MSIGMSIDMSIGMSIGMRLRNEQVMRNNEKIMRTDHESLHFNLYLTWVLAVVVPTP